MVKAQNLVGVIFLLVAASMPALPTAAQDVRVVSGRVLGPEGKPIEGATIFAIPWHPGGFAKEPPIARSASDQDGRFEINIDTAKIRAPTRRTLSKSAVAAIHPDYGPAWVQLGHIHDDKKLELHLVDCSESPVGYVVDVEGQPRANLSVRVQGIRGFGRSGITELCLWQESQPELANYEFKTDDRGMFRITGIGHKRFLTLSISGAEIASDVTSFNPDDHLTGTANNKLAEARGKSLLTVVVEAERKINGVVKDAKTGAPLSGVTIQPRFIGDKYVFESADLWSVRTDKDGRFQMSGLPGRVGIGLTAIPASDQPYFISQISFPGNRSTTELNCEIPMQCGIWISGQVIEKDTLHPVRAELQYFPARENKNTEGVRFYESSYEGFRPFVTDKDGSFRLVGLPGQGLVSVTAFSNFTVDPSVTDFQTKRERDDDDVNDQPWSYADIYSSTAIRYIRPDQEADHFECEFILESKK